VDSFRDGHRALLLGDFLGTLDFRMLTKAQMTTRIVELAQGIGLRGSAQPEEFGQPDRCSPRQGGRMKRVALSGPVYPPHHGAQGRKRRGAIDSGPVCKLPNDGGSPVQIMSSRLGSSAYRQLRPLSMSKEYPNREGSSAHKIKPRRFLPEGIAN